jgi:hypothetical protein
VRAFAGNVDHNRPADEAPHKIVRPCSLAPPRRLPVYHASAWRACALISPELAPDPTRALRKVRQRNNDHDDDKQPCGYLFFDPDPVQHRTSLWRGKSRAGVRFGQKYCRKTNISEGSIVYLGIQLSYQSTLRIFSMFFSKGNTMSNQQQGSNEAPKTPAPGETKPAPQQNQGDAKQPSEKPAQQK